MGLQVELWVCTTKPGFQPDSSVRFSQRTMSYNSKIMTITIIQLLAFLFLCFGVCVCDCVHAHVCACVYMCMYVFIHCDRGSAASGVSPQKAPICF